MRVAALGVILVAVHRLFDPQPIEQVGWGLALSLGSSALNGVLAWWMFRAAGNTARWRWRPMPGIW